MATSNNDPFLVMGGLAGIVAEIEEPGRRVPERPQRPAPRVRRWRCYQFTPAELESVLGQWKQLQTSLQKAQGSVVTMTDVQSPATDTASQTAAGSASRSGQAYQDHLTAMLQYTDTYITALQTALTNYQNAEEGGSQSMRSVNTGF